jgi:hypothetical protein
MPPRSRRRDTLVLKPKPQAHIALHPSSRKGHRVLDVHLPHEAAHT